jgi:hypothetical protein
MQLIDGRLITVMQRDYLLVSPRGRTACVFRPDDSMSFVDLGLVRDVEVRSNRRSDRGEKRH